MFYALPEIHYITQPPIYGVIVYFLLCHESGQQFWRLTGTMPWPGFPLCC